MRPCASTSSESPDPLGRGGGERGRLITLEGIEGAGKSSQLEPLRRALSDLGLPVLTTREPGGSPVAEQIRGILLDPSNLGMAPTAELLLMFASRAEHLAKRIVPALADGTWVLCDRFTDATYAYQGGGRGMDPHAIALLEELVQGGLRPDLTLIFDLPPRVGLERARGRGQSDRFERERVTFFDRIRAVYLDRARALPGRYRVLDGTQPLDMVTAQAVGIITQFADASQVRPSLP